MKDSETGNVSATLSLSTGVFGTAPFLPELQWCRHLGLEAIELDPRNARRVHQSDKMQREFLEKMGRLGLRLGSLHAWAPVDGLADVCPRARALRAELIVVHCGPDSLEQDFDGSVEVTKRWNAWCLDRGMTLAVENASKQRLEPFVRFFEAVPDLSLTLDIRHAYKPKLFGRTHVDYMGALADRIANWHVAGIDRARRPEVGDGTPPGNDAVDWNELTDELARLKYRGLLTIETTIPRDLSPAELEEAYADIPPASPDETTASRRLSRYAVEFFRKQFSRLLFPAAG